MPVPYPQEALTALRGVLAERFSLQDLRTLAFNIGVDPEDLENRETRPGLAVALLTHCIHRYAVLRLIEEARRGRDDISWTELGFPELPPQRRHHDFLPTAPYPLHYLERRDLLDQIRSTLIDRAGSLALTSTPTYRTRADALHGMGGIGKTVLARALCDDPDVQAAFPDGILWATLGQAPDLVARLREWVEALRGIISENAPTVNQLQVKLRDLLQGRACLLVVDDAWQKQHVVPFQVGGPQCRLLLTTRDAALAEDLGADLLHVDVLPLERAKELLTQWAGGALDTAGDAVKTRIVERLGCLPLAIKLAGASIQHAHQTPEAWLEAFRLQKLKSRRAETLHDNLWATLAISVDALDERVRRCYLALAIFREDEPIPFVAATRLWLGLEELDEDQARELWDDLGARTLIQVSEGAFAAVLHDLMRDFIREELGEPGFLDAHRVLLDTYRATQTEPGRWHTAPDDGYLYGHLAYHLNALANTDARAATELEDLFADDAWLQRRVNEQVDYTYDGYLADLTLVWERAHSAALRQIDECSAPGALANCLHYAMIQTTVNSRAMGYPGEVLARAAETGFWPAQRAASAVTRMPDAVQRSAAATLLLEVGTVWQSPELRSRLQLIALAAARQIGHPYDRARALAALAPYLSNESRIQAVDDALLAAGQIAIVSDRLYAMADLIPHLPCEVRSQTLLAMLAGAMQIEVATDQVRILVTLAPHLPTEVRRQAIGGALSTVRRMAGEYSEYNQASALATLAPHLSSDMLPDALATARRLHDDGVRVRTLAALAPHLPSSLRSQVLSDCLALARQIQDRGTRATALAALALHLPPAFLVEGLAAARQIPGEFERADALAALAPHLPPELLLEAVDMAGRIEDGWQCIRAIVALVPHLQPELRRHALTVALAATRRLQSREGCTQALEVLAPHLPPELLPEALATTGQTDDSGARAHSLAVLAPHLSVGQQLQVLTQALAAVNEVQWEGARTIALVAIAPYLPGELLSDALVVARRISDEGAHVQVLTALAPRLSPELFPEALAYARQTPWEPSRAGALAALAPHCPSPLLPDVLADATGIRDAGARGGVLIALIPRLPPDLQTQAVRDALTATGIVDYYHRVRALTALAPHLPPELLPDAMATASQTSEEADGARAEALTALIPYLPPRLRLEALSDALAAARRVRYEYTRAAALAALVPYLPPDLGRQVQVEALAAAREVQLGGSGARARALAAVAPALSPPLRAQALVDALAAIREVQDEGERASALAALATQLPPELLPNALAAATQIQNEGDRAPALVALIPYLPPELRAEALSAARQIENGNYRSCVLASLAQHAQGRGSFQTQFRKATVEHVYRLAVVDRAAVLGFLAQEELWLPGVLGLPGISLTRIAESTIAISTQWRWI